MQNGCNNNADYRKGNYKGPQEFSNVLSRSYPNNSR